MAKAPFMPLYTSDYLGDTGHLSTEEHGAYLLILMQMWNAGGALPADPSKLARVARCSTKKWLAMQDTVLAFFNIDGDQITSNRLTKERQKVEAKTEVRRSAGAKGGAAKALKTKERPVANAIAKPCHSPDAITIEETTANAVVVLATPKAENVDYVRADRAFQLFVQAAHRQPCWSIPEAINKTRRASLMARIREVGLDGWERAIHRAEQSPFLTGRIGEKPFALALDWMLKPANFTKIVEGNYDDRTHPAANGAASRSSNASRNGSRTEAFDRLADRLQGGSDRADAWQHDDPATEGGYVIDASPTRITG